MQTGRWRTLLVSLAIVAAFVVVLRLMGRLAWCECGFRLWTHQSQGTETSQHLADPYSFTHVLHGIIFYAVLAWLAKRPAFARHLSRDRCIVIALLLEVAWEIVENTPWVIERYREATAARGYYGDTILNCLGDVIACMLGYYLAARLPVWWSVAFAVAIELVLLATIRDNLTLNVVMLFYPIESVKQWQLGG
jgi:hypothetical protein